MDIIGKNVTQSSTLKYLWTDQQKAVLSQMSMHGPWVAGGAALALHEGQGFTTDMDVFCQNAEQVLAFGDWLKEQNANIIAQTDNNTTYNLDGQLVQLIHGRTYGNLVELFESFDFHLCQFATDGHMVWCTFQAEKDNRNKVLTINKITIPLRTLARVVKYHDKGFYADRDVLLELSKAAREELQKAGVGGSTGC